MSEYLCQLTVQRPEREVICSWQKEADVKIYTCLTFCFVQMYSVDFLHFVAAILILQIKNIV